jgi:hypothetical protein
MLDIAISRGRAGVSPKHMKEYSKEIREEMENIFEDLYLPIKRKLLKMIIKSKTIEMKNKRTKGRAKDRPWQEEKVEVTDALNEVATTLLKSIDIALAKGIPHERNKPEKKPKKPQKPQPYNEAVALQIFINRWAMATTDYETTYTPARTKIIIVSMEIASTIALRDIVDQNTTNIQWSESAYKYIKRRMLSIKMLSPIVEHLLPPPEIEEDQNSTFEKWNLWSQGAMGHAGAQMARTLEADIAQRIAQAARQDQKLRTTTKQETTATL